MIEDWKMAQMDLPQDSLLSAQDEEQKEEEKKGRERTRDL